jgi:hypothetical protein
MFSFVEINDATDLIPCADNRGYDSLTGPISNTFYCRGACSSSRDSVYLMAFSRKIAGPNSYVVIMNKGIDTTIWVSVVFDSINLRPYRSPSVAFAPLEGRTIISGVYDSLKLGFRTKQYP